MKRFLVLFYLLTFTLAFSQEEDSLSINKDGIERITSFHSDINVDKKSALNITENINVHSLGINIKRGIYRALPLSRNLNNLSSG
ncbi:hypothetical protein [Chryseobacterium limigenitum]|uniref:Uncharacterized protein n=1 Tax=Chryseobacterium limigenitum TaxID=1612149 RepID=A0A1K2IVP7_9FLAO|nr:hypothetical protein [Chryseobacterium limigenitum]SFZ96439.1 hypothetical protein SAMN05216324_1202 [Chryseobacterium limigenitum]